jgi:hypothetical protein
MAAMTNQQSPINRIPSGPALTDVPKIVVR